MSGIDPNVDPSFLEIFQPPQVTYRFIDIGGVYRPELSPTSLNYVGIHVSPFDRPPQEGVGIQTKDILRIF